MPLPDWGGLWAFALLMTDVRGTMSHKVVQPYGCAIRKWTEQAMGNNILSCTPPWPLLHSCLQVSDLTPSNNDLFPGYIR